MGSGGSTNQKTNQNENLQQKNQFLWLQNQNNSMKSINKKFPSKIQSEYSYQINNSNQVSPKGAKVMTEEIYIE